MLDKTLIKEKFTSSIDSYDDNAIIQELMAKKLISLLPSYDFDNILEIGSYSGILTKKIIKKCQFKNYLAVDIIDSFNKIQNLSEKIQFQKIDIEKFTTSEKFNLIIANASLQWCENFKNTIKKLKSYLTKNGILAITTFATDNFYEIRETFNVSLKYNTISELEEIFSPKAQITQEIYTLQFKNPNQILKHLKLTGVNAVTNNELSITQIKRALVKLENEFQNKLTYKPIYIIFKA